MTRHQATISAHAGFGEPCPERSQMGTPTTQMASPWQNPGRRSISGTGVAAHHRGFTLIEILVVIGILVALIGLLIPAVFHAYKVAGKTRTAADLALIGTALEAYKQDNNGDYPRFDDDNTAGGLNMQPNRGAILLCRALLGPGGTAVDGADGLGFRPRAINNNGTMVYTGKVYGPYIQSDKFQLSQDTVNDPQQQTTMLLDHEGNPILYFPATPGHPNIQSANGFVYTVNPPGNPGSPGYAAPPRPLYNSYDNTAVPPPAMANPNATFPNGLSLLPENQMQYIMGDRNYNGMIDSTTMPPEAAVYTGPYILWTAGADGIYGFGNDPATMMPRVPAAGMKTDDVTNFDMAPDLAR
jgi:prepilin-type N-terminal cleavage/methylation domain-containing protein